jgi:hypothetical protein
MFTVQGVQRMFARIIIPLLALIMMIFSASVTGTGVAVADTGLASAEHSTTASPGTSTASDGAVVIQSGCTTPPCGDIYNHTNAWFNIKRQDCDGCGWIYSSVGPGQHKGGYWNDGIDWDAFAVPYRCSVNTTISGINQVFDNYSTNPQKWISFSSNLTVHLNSYSCSGS